MKRQIYGNEHYDTICSHLSTCSLEPPPRSPFGSGRSGWGADDDDAAQVAYNRQEGEARERERERENRLIALCPTQPRDRVRVVEVWDWKRVVGGVGGDVRSTGCLT